MSTNSIVTIRRATCCCRNKNRTPISTSSRIAHLPLSILILCWIGTTDASWVSTTSRTIRCRNANAIKWRTVTPTELTTIKLSLSTDKDYDKHNTNEKCFPTTEQQQAADIEVIAEQHRGQLLSSTLSSRRQLFLDGISKISSAGLLLSSTFQLQQVQPAFALPAIIPSVAVCDPTVSVWELNNRRLVYLLGTAHISELSAELAGNLVRDAHPNAIFIELDIKRIGGLSRSMSQRLQKEEEKQREELLQAGTELPTEPPPRPKVRIIIPDFKTALPLGITTTSVAETATGTSTVDTPLFPTPPVAPVVNQEGGNGFNFFNIRQKAMNFASAAVGNALKGMYKNLDSAGFNPGEEFVSAIIEGQKINADVVLGDQDVEKTLRRLTEALTVTDFNKIANADAEFEKTMNELMPGGGAGKPPPNVVFSSSDDPTKYKAELTEYIEKLKSRENVRKIMSQLNDIAPALVQAMLTERDAYMAAGIDVLNEYECIVAVMGIAHLDGVERNLMDKGWKPIPLTTQCRRYQS